MKIPLIVLKRYRSGATMQELNGTSLQQFIMKKMGKSWDDISNENATLDDIDREAINYFLRKGIDANRIPEDERNASVKDVLTSLHLMDENGRLKNAALLLFGKDPLKFFTSVRFKIGRFGVDEADLLIQDVIEGNIIHSSKPRNRNIADTMFKAGFIDTWGRGYKKIHDGFEKVGLPMPKVESHCGGTLVTFQRGYDVISGRKNVPSDVPSLSPVQLTERQKKICDLIRKNPRISASEMSPVLSVVVKTVKRDLVAMQKKGVLIREGNTSAGHWVLLIEI